MRQYGAVIWPTPDQQSRYDLEFLGRMLGLRPGVDYAPSGVVLSDRPSIQAAIIAGVLDPVANARARRRIGELLAQCEHVEVFAGYHTPCERPDRAATQYPDRC